MGKKVLVFLLFLLFIGWVRAQQEELQKVVGQSKQTQVFGRNIFASRNLSFEPNLNIPTPENYMLGPGDEVIIDIWGTSENTVRETISPEGSIVVENIGPIYLSGLNMQEAEQHLRREFSKIYAAISGESVHIKVTLGKIRSIMVNVMGEVEVPGTYRLSAFASVFHALYRAGGVNRIGSLRTIQVVRNGEKVADVDVYKYIMEGKLADDIRLSEGDVILVSPYENLVGILGKVKRPMIYEMKQGESLAALINYAGGFTGDAFLNRALLKREREDLSHEMIPVDLRKLMEGSIPDLSLQKNDVLYISSIRELEKEGTLAIYGDVANPGHFPFAKNMTIQDLILKAGGLLESASTVRIDVSRRIKDAKSTSSSSVIGKSFTVELENGLLVGAKRVFELEPYDMVFIRRSPGYQKQANVTVDGEVIFTGNYALTKRNERLSDLIAKAGGLSKDAYVKGARLMRRMTADEIRQKQDAVRFAVKGTGKDSVSLAALEVDQTYSVGIELEKALAKPKSDEDLVLREGDVLFIPKYVSTVTITGAVMYPNTVLYQKGSGIDYYIGQAGGFGNRALKRRAYVVYMNGTVSRLRHNTANAIEPGCEIIVPTKEERKKATVSGAVGMSSSMASIAAMVASMVSLTK